jgi:hypothetical protein
MAPGAQIDYDALAQQSGGAPAVNYDQLAQQYGGTPGQAPAPPPTDDQIPSPHESMLSTIGNNIANFGQSEVSEAAKSLGGIDKMVSKIPYVGKALTTPLIGGATSEQAQSDLAQVANDPGQGAAGVAGGFMEDALEFLLGDTALKGLTLPQKLKEVIPALKAIETNSTMANALRAAMRTGTVAAGQTLAKTGGDVGEAAEQGAIGAATGGLITGAAGKLTDEIAARSPQTTNVAGENIVTPKPAQVPPEVQAAQTAGKNVIAKTATEAAQRNVIQDVPATVRKVQSFGEAADQVEKSAKDAYGNIDQATAGKFTQARDDFEQARKDVQNAVGPMSRDEAQLRLDNANTRMRAIFEEADGKVSQQDWKDANSAWNNAKTLRQVHNAVESTFDTDAGFSQRSGTYRGFNGNQLRQNLNRLTQKIGEPELNRVIGRDNMDNLRKVAELTRTNADRARFGAAVQKVGGWLARESAAAGVGAMAGHLTGLGGFGGAVGGEAAYMAARKVMQMVATNPRVGQQLTFAVESGARPEYYAPLIGKMIRDAEDEGK